MGGYASSDIVTYICKQRCSSWLVWLPIYGSGGILILICLKKLRNKPVVEFFASVVLCGFVEYFTSLYLEISHGRRWWNYNGYFLTLMEEYVRKVF